MNNKKILIGVIIWTISLCVVLLYHILLMSIAIHDKGHSYSYHSMVKYFFDLPWLVWPYLVASWITGTALVISGFKSENS